jgi:hypothetical protein
VNVLDEANRESANTAASGVTPKIGALVSIQAALRANTYNNGSAGVRDPYGQQCRCAVIDGVEVRGGGRVLIKYSAAPRSSTQTLMTDR